MVFCFFIFISVVGSCLTFLWHSCFVCLFSLDSLGTYLESNRFNVKHVGLFILRSYIVVVEIELPLELEWSRQPGMVTALLFGLQVALGKDHPLTFAIWALFRASWFRGSTLTLLGYLFPQPGWGGLRDQGDMATWNPGAYHLDSSRLRYLVPKVPNSLPESAVSSSWSIAVHMSLGWAGS